MRRTPQEKKRLSYAKDTRDAYYANAKASRRRKPLKKRHAAKTDRGRARQILGSANGPVDPAAAESAETRLAHRPPAALHSANRLWPDQPLGPLLRWRLRDRAERGMLDPETAAARIARLDRRVPPAAGG
ncbi:hypothetical protein CLV63_101214 [Murinocardiopsis flavida]|uniref:Uncharacterized protein n=1 Tax=Murinocardiopsis flavida TaxID=645275 RepID=A0A2P8DU42_9ACTN|nr:hypothetical protein [Murinocardiopsis flavida]PSL00740.1 hypothetical protein CLV63_101214 [Murinocardiopsis flavida]